MVQPAPQPQPVSVATASTSGWSGSGVTPAASGSPSGAFTGPHYVEEQSLTIRYGRMPMGTDWNVTTFLNLSSASVSNINIFRTGLFFTAQASYTRKKVDAIFSTSSYQQPQKFEFNAVSADYQGSSYGSITSATLGPQGEIITVQPWYYRRPWDNTSDTEVTSAVNFSNHAIGRVVYGPSQTSSILTEEQENYLTYPHHFLSPQSRHTFLYDSEAYRWDYTNPYYSLFGPYSTDQESLADIIAFIDQVGNTLSSQGFFAVPAVHSGFGTFFNHDIGIPEYATFRHDYS